MERHADPERDECDRGQPRLQRRDQPGREYLLRIPGHLECQRRRADQLHAERDDLRLTAVPGRRVHRACWSLPTATCWLSSGVKAELDGGWDWEIGPGKTRGGCPEAPGEISIAGRSGGLGHLGVALRVDQPVWPYVGTAGYVLGGGVERGQRAVLSVLGDGR